MRSTYQQYLSSPNSALARSVLQRIGTVKDVWTDYMCPLIRSKIFATLQATSERVIARNRSFEFLGYDVIIDQALVPWILEVNMSPAMAHRTPEQCTLIETMSKGLLKLAVLPYFPNNNGSAAEISTNSNGAVQMQTASAAAASTMSNTSTLSVSNETPESVQQESPRVDSFPIKPSYGEWERLSEPTTGDQESGDLIAQDDVNADGSADNSSILTFDTAPTVPVGDWDEILPPAGIAIFPSKPSKPNELKPSRQERRPSSASALHRKYSGISSALADSSFQNISTNNSNNSNNNNIDNTSEESSSENSSAKYFQKFVNAAAAAASSAGAGTSTSTGTTTGTMNVAANIMAVGTAVDNITIDKTDQLCTGFHKLLTLQRYCIKRTNFAIVTIMNSL